LRRGDSKRLIRLLEANNHGISQRIDLDIPLAMLDQIEPPESGALQKQFDAKKIDVFGHEQTPLTANIEPTEVIYYNNITFL
jgi:hypothetical protein